MFNVPRGRTPSYFVMSYREWENLFLLFFVGLKGMGGGVRREREFVWNSG